MSAKRLLSVFLRYGISLLCLVYAFHGVPLADLWVVLCRFPVLPMAAAVLGGFAAYAVMGVRLQFMWSPRLAFRSTFGASLVGQALNNVLPAKAGEIAKAAWIARDHRGGPWGLTFDSALGLVFVERFYDVNVLTLLSLWFMWALGQRGVALTLISCLCLGWAVLILLRQKPDWVRFWGLLRLPAKATEFLTRFTLSLIEQMAPRRVLWMIISSLALWALYDLQMTVTLNGAAGLGLSWSEALGVFALSSLGMLLPSSPGALGVYEAVTVTALTAYGVSRDQALAVALFAHMAQFIPVTLVGGLVFLAFPEGRGRLEGKD